MQADNAAAYFYGGDTLHGGTLDDRLYGDNDFDLLMGGGFSDTTFTSTGVIEALDETSGNDTLSGDDGIDALYGLDGPDRAMQARSLALIAKVRISQRRDRHGVAGCAIRSY